MTSEQKPLIVQLRVSNRQFLFFRLRLRAIVQFQKTALTNQTVSAKSWLLYTPNNNAKPQGRCDTVNKNMDNRNTNSVK